MAKQNQQQLVTMRRGPRLDAIEPHIVIVPVVWCNDVATKLWQKQGFHYNSTLREWLRDSREPTSAGKTYSTAAWLKAARQHYYRLYPKAQLLCRKCGQQIFPTANYQTFYCADCRATAHHTEKWR